MPRRTALTDLLGIEHPLIQAPMASAATPELVVAVSEAGGLGSLGSAMLPTDELRRQADAVRAATSRPFQLNFFCHSSPELGHDEAQLARHRVALLYAELGLGEPPEPTVPPFEFDDARLEATLEIRPAVVSFHFGLPDDAAVRALREADIRVLASATTVTEARELEQSGVDAVIAQGAEAGGHRGSFLVPGEEGLVGTLALVPQVVDAVSVPVIAAGGIADGRGLAAALALGAAGAQVGTAFLACPEATVQPPHREALHAAQAEGTTITSAISGRPARALRNRLTDELEAVQPLPYPAQLSLIMPLVQATRRARLRGLPAVVRGPGGVTGATARRGRARADDRRRRRARARVALAAAVAVEGGRIDQRQRAVEAREPKHFLHLTGARHDFEGESVLARAIHVRRIIRSPDESMNVRPRRSSTSVPESIASTTSANRSSQLRSNSPSSSTRATAPICSTLMSKSFGTTSSGSWNSLSRPSWSFGPRSRRSPKRFLSKTDLSVNPVHLADMSQGLKPERRARARSSNAHPRHRL